MTRARIVGLGAALGLAALVACTQSPSETTPTGAAGSPVGDKAHPGVTTPPQEREPDPMLSEPLLIGLAQAKNYHHQADVYLADGNQEAAITAVSNVLRLRFPLGAPEGEDVMLDARARLGKLYLGAGRLDEAAKVVDEGIAAPSRESFFLANLWTVAGEVHQARAMRLDATDKEGAHKERQTAIDAYGKSISINDRLQVEILKEPEGGAGAGTAGGGTGAGAGTKKDGQP